MREAGDQESISTGQLARRLGVHPVTARRWRSEGKGPAWFKIGRNVRYRISDVEVWLEANTEND